MDAELDRRVADSTNVATRSRGDLQGLRAVAVLLVALDHAGVGFLKGGYVGVDVFFVLSGYLITGVLVRAAKSSGSKSFFATFYARRARRILPAAVLTLIVTDIAASALLNLYRAHQVLSDSLSATFFVANFHFASIGTNYFAKGQPPSPVQHFWSLSVEEQFYVVWPFLVAICLLGVFVARRRRQERKVSAGAVRNLEAVAILITVASLFYSIYFTQHDATAAYFSTPARAWELGLGALLSLNAGRVARLPSVLQASLGWGGVAAIIAASVLYSASTPFPGAAALLPTLGAVGVIIGGIALGQALWAPSRILSLKPMRFIGDRSYTIYLWHWPVLMLATESAGHTLSLGTNLLLLLGAFLLSMVTYAFFENPIRRSRRMDGPRGLVLWPAAILVVLFVTSNYWSSYQNAVNAAVVVSVPKEVLTEQAGATASTSGKSKLDPSPSSPAALVASVAAVKKRGALPSPLNPSPLSLNDDLYTVPAGCIAKPGVTYSTICSLGVNTSKRTLVVFGDSHAQMWMPAIVAFAQREGYDVRPVLKYSCNPYRWMGVEKTSECADWFRWAVPQVRALHPSLLILATHYDVSPAEAEIEYTQVHSDVNIAAWGKAVKAAAKRIVVIGDPPGQQQEPVDCLLAPHATMKKCSNSPVQGQIEAGPKVEQTVKSFAGFLDTTPWLCYQLVCPMVIGHTVAYIDHDHLSKAYTEELAPLFVTALQRVLAKPLAASKAKRT